MNRISAVTVFALIMFGTGICQADSLVITYRSGKTQTVVLDEPSQGINSWQFIGGSVSQRQPLQQDEPPAPAKQEQLRKEPVDQPQAGSKPAEKAPEGKSGVRIKWNAKPIAD